MRSEPFVMAVRRDGRYTTFDPLTPSLHSLKLSHITASAPIGGTGVRRSFMMESDDESGGDEVDQTSDGDGPGRKKPKSAGAGPSAGAGAVQSSAQTAPTVEESPDSTTHPVVEEDRGKGNEKSQTLAEEIEGLEQQLKEYSDVREHINRQLEHLKQQAYNVDIAYSAIYARLNVLKELKDKGHPLDQPPP